MFGAMKTLLHRLLTLIIVLSSAGWVQAQQTKWKQMEDLPGSERHHPVTFSINGYGYALTGLAVPSRLLRDFYKYDARTNQWETMTDFPGAARSFAYGAEYNGKGYVGFGLSQAAYLNDLWEYDPGTDSWKQLSSCPCSGRRHPAFTITSNGKLFVGMGDGQAGNMRDWWEYDIASDTWSQKVGLPGAARHHPYYFSLGTDAYVGFGHGTGLNIFKDFYKFNTLTDAWEQMQDFPGEARVAGSQFSHNGFGYVISGEGSDHNNLDTGEVYQYDPAKDSWKEMEPHPGSGLWAPGTFVVEDSVYLIAGEDAASDSQKSLWKFELPASKKQVPANVETKEGETITSFTVYPNPVTGGVLRIGGVIPEAVKTLSLFSLDGQMVQEFKSNHSGSYTLNDELAGIYLLVMHTVDGSMGRQLIMVK